MSEAPVSKRERPLSPHLQVYKPQLTSVLSIFHRFCGVALSIGTLYVAWWLIALATDEEAFGNARWFAMTPVGQFMLLGWSFALYYHLCNGIRHFIWDTGRLFKIENAYTAGYIVLLSAIALTASTWYCAKNFGHGAQKMPLTLAEYSEEEE